MNPRPTDYESATLPLSHIGSKIDYNRLKAIFTHKNQKNPMKKPDSKQYEYLRAEAKAPYKGLRKFIYVGFGASGFIGAFIFLMQLLAGKSEVLPNLALQVGLIALMALFWKLEKK